MGTESLSGHQRAESEAERFDHAADLALAALTEKLKKTRGSTRLTQSAVHQSATETQTAKSSPNQAQTTEPLPDQGQWDRLSKLDGATMPMQTTTPILKLTKPLAPSPISQSAPIPQSSLSPVPLLTSARSLTSLPTPKPTPPRAPTSPPTRPKTSSSRSTMDEYRHTLLGGLPQFSAQQVADLTVTSLELVQEFWGAMGFQPVKPSQVAFTSRDVEAYGAWAHLIESGAVDLATARSLAQAQSHLADRLALWQVEALVEDASRRLDLDDTSARLVALDHMRDYLDVLRDTMVYAWQRQLENLLTRVDRDVSQRGHEEARRRFPLTRSLGFADMVSFTASSSIMGDKMVALIERFEDVCRTAVAASGGHVVKMIGDAVFFVADDLGTGLRLVTNLLDYLQADPQILPVRASFVRGDVFSRSGDLFGPTVNLAARLVDVAPVGRILTDASTAAAIAAGKGGSGYWLENFPSADLRGFGRVSPYLLSRVQQ